jgi:hypothetical protein
MKVQLCCTQLEDSHRLVLYHDVLSVGARSLLVFRFTLWPPYLRYTLNNKAVIAQALLLLVTDWTVLASNSGGGENFHTHPDGTWGALSPLYNRYRVFPGDKVDGAWLEHQPHPAPRLKKE